MLLQPWGIYVNGKSSNQKASLGVPEVPHQPRELAAHDRDDRLGLRAQDVDWKPLLAKTPQFATFVTPPKDMVYYVEPILTPWDEIQTKMADKLTAAYIDPEPERQPGEGRRGRSTRWRRRPTSS